MGSAHVYGDGTAGAWLLSCSLLPGRLGQPRISPCVQRVCLRRYLRKQGIWPIATLLEFVCISYFRSRPCGQGVRLHGDVTVTASLHNVLVRSQFLAYQYIEFVLHTLSI